MRGFSWYSVPWRAPAERWRWGGGMRGQEKKMEERDIKKGFVNKGAMCLCQSLASCALFAGSKIKYDSVTILEPPWVCRHFVLLLTAVFVWCCYRLATLSNILHALSVCCSSSNFRHTLAYIRILFQAPLHKSMFIEVKL